MAIIRNVITSASTALSTSYASITVGTNTPFPADCLISHVDLEMDTLSTATEVTWYLCRDAEGDVPISNEVTSAIIDQGSGSALGGFGAAINVAYAIDTDAGTTAGELYVRAKVDAATPNAIARITVEVD